MALRAMISVLLLLLVHTSHGHFTINYPTPLGSDSNNEGIGPCGGFKFSDAPSVSEFHVGGDAIALVTTHPQANILFRATLDTTASENWSQLWPIVGQYGLGAYCQASVTVPAGWAGSNGIIQVIEDAVDGTLYQCAGVKFVAGKASFAPSVCNNGTGITFSYVSDSTLPASSTSGSSSNTTTITPASTLTPSTTAKSSSNSIIAPSMALSLIMGLCVLLART